MGRAASAASASSAATTTGRRAGRRKARKKGDGLARGSWKRSRALQRFRGAEGRREGCRVGATAEGTRPKGRRIALLRADAPDAVAVVAEREGDPWLVFWPMLVRYLH